jgi:hypothetical protein
MFITQRFTSLFLIFKSNLLVKKSLATLRSLSTLREIGYDAENRFSWLKVRSSDDVFEHDIDTSHSINPSNFFLMIFIIRKQQTFVRDVRIPEQCRWKINSCGIRRPLFGYFPKFLRIAVPSSSGSSWTAWPWRWHHDPSTHSKTHCHIPEDLKLQCTFTFSTPFETKVNQRLSSFCAVSTLRHNFKN